jgi:Kef-type K+ transport system membrane component KefB
MKKIKKIKDKDALFLAVYFSSVGDVKNFYNFFSVENSINYSIVSNAQAVIRSIAQFFIAKRPGVIFQGKKFRSNAILEGCGQFSELVFGAGNDLDLIVHQAFFSLRSSVKKIFKGRDDWQLRVSAMVKSIISSLKLALWIRPNNIAFCSDLASAPNAVRKTSALACIVVIIEPPFLHKFTTGVDACQGRISGGLVEAMIMG